MASVPVGTKSHCRTCKKEIEYVNWWDPPATSLYPNRQRDTWLHDESRQPKCNPDDIIDDEFKTSFRMTAMPDHLCIDNIESQDYYNDRCYRRVKERGVCGIHLKPLLERDAQIKADQERQNAKMMLDDLFKEILQYLADRGIQAKRHYNDQILIDPEDFIGLMAQEEDFEVFES
jgi:hypothetical protein